MLRRTLLSTATAVRTGVLKTVKPVFSRSMGYYTNEVNNDGFLDGVGIFRANFPRFPQTIPFHRSDAEERINAIPPIEVEGYHAVCDGGELLL